MTDGASISKTGAGLPVTVAAFLFLALVTMTAATFGSLPDRIPVHFGFSGVPDGWSDKGIGAWFLPILSVVMGLIFWGSAWVVRNKPAWVNVPRKAEFTALAPEARAPVVAMLVRFVAWMAALVEALFIFIQAGIFAVATGQWAGLPGWPIVGVIGLFIVYILVMYVRISHAIKLASGAKPS